MRLSGPIKYSLFWRARENIFNGVDFVLRPFECQLFYRAFSVLENVDFFKSRLVF